MIVTTVRYRRFLRYVREESYIQSASGQVLQHLSVAVLVFFVVGFLVGAADVALRDVEPIFLLVALVFFVGAVYVALLIQTQMDMAADLRTKTMEVMHVLVKSVEMKDRYTQGHSWHVYHIVKVFCAYLPDRLLRRLKVPKLLDAALLHDIGKIGVSDGILNKQGPLTPGEWVVVKTHPEVGRQVLADTCLAEIAAWVAYHHERVDGKGYAGLVGEEIPLEARIIAIADTYSAMTTDREYCPKRSHPEALAEMQRVAGSQLDATLVRYFCAIPAEELEKDAAFRRPEPLGGTPFL